MCKINNQVFIVLTLKRFMPISLHYINYILKIKKKNRQKRPDIPKVTLFIFSNTSFQYPKEGGFECFKSWLSNFIPQTVIIALYNMLNNSSPTRCLYLSNIYRLSSFLSHLFAKLHIFCSYNIFHKSISSVLSCFP